MKLFVIVNIILCLTVVVTAEYRVSKTNCAGCLKQGEKLSEEIKSAVVDIAPLTTCVAVGKAIAKVTNSTLAGTIAGVICAAVGLEVFKKEFQKTELNYGWACEKIGECKKEIGSGSLDSVKVNSPITLGGDIKLKIVFSVSKEAGVLEFMLNCLNVTAKTNSTDKQFEIPAKVGLWEADWEIPTTNWVAGNYTCGVKLCNTICDALPKEPELGMKEVKFEITKKGLII